MGVTRVRSSAGGNCIQESCFLARGVSMRAARARCSSRLLAGCAALNVCARTSARHLPVPTLVAAGCTWAAWPVTLRCSTESARARRRFGFGVHSRRARAACVHACTYRRTLDAPPPATRVVLLLQALTTPTGAPNAIRCVYCPAWQPARVSHAQHPRANARRGRGSAAPYSPYYKDQPTPNGYSRGDGGAAAGMPRPLRAGEKKGQSMSHLLPNSPCF